MRRKGEPASKDAGLFFFPPLFSWKWAIEKWEWKYFYLKRKKWIHVISGSSQLLSDQSQLHPHRGEKKGANGFVFVFLSGGDWNTLSWDWERQGDTHRPPLPVQLQLGSGLGAWRGLLSPSVVLCRRTARCYHKFWRYRRKSANLLGPGFPHL